MEDRTHNGVKFRILNVMDEFTRECLAVRVARSLISHNVIEVLTELFIERGVPVHIRSDNGPEFIAKRVRDWLERLQVRPLFILNQVVPGKMAMLNHSTAKCRMNCSTWKSFFL